MTKDRKFNVATGTSRKATIWKTHESTWEKFQQRFQGDKVTRTDETMTQYMGMTRDGRTAVKDVGGYVAGKLNGKKRIAGNVVSRSMVTLDLDNINEPAEKVWNRIQENLPNCTLLVHSSHSHTPEKPRLRIIIPLAKDITPEKYVPVSRKIAGSIGIELFDATTYDINRLMFWPSVSKDGEYFHRTQTGELCNPDDILAQYGEGDSWRNAALWPKGENEVNEVRDKTKEAEDPTKKKCDVGNFCRAYSIEEAIDKFLPEVYVPGENGRYTYTKGTTSNGLVIYDNKFAYSHHGSDPAQGNLLNAFDLVRIHKFGNLDKGQEPENPTQTKSYKAMIKYLTGTKDEPGDKEFLYQRHIAMKDMANDDLEGIEAEAQEWRKSLAFDKNGHIKDTYANLEKIMLNDCKFKTVKYDEFSHTNIPDEVDNPFEGTHGKYVYDDTSYTRMCRYLESEYGISFTKIPPFLTQMLTPTAPERKINAVQEYIKKEQWDGKERLDTMLIDYLGAEDTPLTRAVTRKWMCGAVARAFEIDEETGEGIKFDYCLILKGKQGIGKSTLTQILARRWRGQINLSDKEQTICEALTTAWIIEIPELSGIERANNNVLKDLITRPSDDFRQAYGFTRNKNPRRCVFIGSTNLDYFLKDDTGNRRFWIVEAEGKDNLPHLMKVLRKEVNQLWAEAYFRYSEGEELMLSDEMEEEMKIKATGYNVINDDPAVDIIRKFLDIPLPGDWDKRNEFDKKAYYNNPSEIDLLGKVTRNYVSILEIQELSELRHKRYRSKSIGYILKDVLGWLDGWLEGGVTKGGQVRIPGFKGKDGKNKKSTLYRRPVPVYDEEDDEL